MRISLRRQESASKKDYSRYEWQSREIVLELVRTAGEAAIFAWFFYRSVWAFVPMLALSFLGWRKRRREKIREARRKLVLQFQECILSVAASLRTGYSAENAFLESLQDMRRLYGENADICREIELIRRGLVINITLEELLEDFGRRSGSEEIRDFAEVFVIAKRSGGSIPEIITASVQLIKQRIQAEEDIHAALSSRKLEQRIMNAMPFVIVLYIESTNKGYFDSLYHNFFGAVIMSVCLAVYLGAGFLAGHILDKACGLWKEDGKCM